MSEFRKPSTLASRFGFQDPDLTTPVHDEIVLWLVSHIQEVIEYLAGEARVDVLADERANLQAALSALAECQTHEIAQVERLRAILRNQEKQAPEPENDLPAWVTSDAAPSSWEASRILDHQKNLATINTQIIDFQTQLDQLPAHHWLPVTEAITTKRCEQPILSGTYTIGFVDLYVQTTRNVPLLPEYAEPRFQMPKTLPKLRHREMPRDYYFEVKPKIPSFGELVRQLRMYQTYVDRESRIIVVSPDSTFVDPIRAEGFRFLGIYQDENGIWHLDS